MEDNIQVDEDDPNYSEYFTVRGEALFACNECGHLTVQLLKLIYSLRISQGSIHKI